MTRKEMDECRHLPIEIKSIEAAMKSPRVQDVIVFYKDYRTGKGIPKVKREHDGGEEDLKKLTKSLEAYNKKLTKRLREAEEFIQTIDDPEIRTIFRLYYIAGMSQEQIGAKLHCVQSRISQIINQFWFMQMANKSR